MVEQVGPGGALLHYKQDGDSSSSSSSNNKLAAAAGGGAPAVAPRAVAGPDKEEEAEPAVLVEEQGADRALILSWWEGLTASDPPDEQELVKRVLTRRGLLEAPGPHALLSVYQLLSLAKTVDDHVFPLCNLASASVRTYTYCSYDSLGRRSEFGSRRQAGRQADRQAGKDPVTDAAAAGWGC